MVRLVLVLIISEGWCLEGEKILSICERGDDLLAEEVAKVYKGKKISKGLKTQSQHDKGITDVISCRNIASNDCIS